MKNTKLWIAINEVTELAEELMVRSQEELETADWLDDEPDTKRTIKANIKAGKKQIEAIWKNADLLKELLGVKP